MYRVEKLPITNVRQASEKLNKLEKEGFRLVPGFVFQDGVRAVIVLEQVSSPEKKEKPETKRKASPKKEATIDMPTEEVNEMWEEVTVT